MKKTLFVVAVAAIAMTACTNEKNEYVGSGSEQKEIAFMPVTQKATRAAVQSATFPDQDMFVVAYQASPVTGDYFEKTTFTKGTTYWEGSPKKYWPLSAATINFLAVTGIATANTAHVTFPATGSVAGTANVTSATVAYTSTNSYGPTSQQDIMYAVGQGSVTQGNTNTLTFPANVAMTFYHALAMINFQVKAYSDVEASAITVNSIKLNGAQYTGTLTITNNAACTTSSAQVKPTVAWSGDTAPTGNDRPTVVNVPSSITTTYAPVNDNSKKPGDVGYAAWACMMVIPTSFTSFTINYTVTDGVTPHNYDYTYVPGGYDGGGAPIATSLTEGNKYNYQITFKLHEILIDPSVDTWDETNSAFDIQ